MESSEQSFSSATPFGTLFTAPPGFETTPFAPYEAPEMFEEQAEARARREETDEAQEEARAAFERPQHYSIGTPSTTDRLLDMLSRSAERQDRLLSMMMERMNHLEQRLSAAPTSSSAGFGVGRGIPPPPPVGGPPSVSATTTGGALGDGKLPFGVPMPVADHKRWKSRHAEVLGYRSWLESFSSWIALFGEVWPREVRECVTHDNAISIRMLNSEQKLRFEVVVFHSPSILRFDKD